MQERFKSDMDIRYQIIVGLLYPLCSIWNEVDLVPLACKDERSIVYYQFVLTLVINSRKMSTHVCYPIEIIPWVSLFYTVFCRVYNLQTCRLHRVLFDTRVSRTSSRTGQTNHCI